MMIDPTPTGGSRPQCPATINKGPSQLLVSREAHPEETVVDAGGIKVGPPWFVVIAGPCAVEDPHTLFETALAVAGAGASILRGGAYKPRTSPYSFQGLEVQGLRLLKEASQLTGLPVVTEVMDPRHISIIEEHADILQVGARNVQNTTLLKEVGKAGRPVLLKRGFMTTVEELLLSAEYIMAEGNHRIILCERGIRTFDPATRNTLDLGAVPVLKERTHLPVIVDPSHATGNWRYVGPLVRAALAVGADGVMVEVHSCPQQALCDGPQSLKPDRFARIMEELRRMTPMFHREIPCVPPERRTGGD